MSLPWNTNDDEDGGIDVDLLISEIENRPGIYNDALTEFSDEESQMILWCEVARAVSPAWNDWEYEMKQDKVQEVQTKWWMLKDMFIEHRESSRLSTSSEKKKKKYKYFDKMDFLEPFINAEKPDAESECTSTSVWSQECQEQPNEPSTSSVNQDGIIQNDDMELALPLPGRTDAEENSVANPDDLQYDLDLLKQEIDENTHFFLKLVPMMRKLTDAQKRFARKAILRTMRQADWIVDIHQEDYEPPQRRIRFHEDPPSELQLNETDSTNVGGPQELEPGLVYPFPPITERSDDQVQAYQVQAGPSCSYSQPQVQPPVNPNQGRITILQNELKYPECNSPEPDV